MSSEEYFNGLRRPLIQALSKLNTGDISSKEVESILDDTHKKLDYILNTIKTDLDNALYEIKTDKELSCQTKNLSQN